MTCKEIMFEGSKGIEISTKEVRLVITMECGPRIAYWGRPGEDNLLLWAPGKYFRNEWDLLGGHRIWVTRPGADEGEETYVMDTEPCTVEYTDTGCIVTGTEDPATHIQRSIGVRVLGENRVEIDNSVANRGNLLFSGGVWPLTCTVPSENTTYAIPLGDDSPWDYCKVVMFRRWETHTGGYDDDQFTFTSDMLLLTPKGKENKRMVQAVKGIIAMNDPERDILFAKKAPYFRDLTYPQDCNIAIYTGPESFMVEMETMGAEKMLKPGESMSHTETWVLTSACAGLTVSELENVFYHK
jgi:hypothetical protein